MESCIKQNNAIEIYQDYFSEIDEATDCEEPKAKVKYFSVKDTLDKEMLLADGQLVPRSRCS